MAVAFILAAIVITKKVSELKRAEKKCKTARRQTDYAHFLLIKIILYFAATAYCKPFNKWAKKLPNTTFAGNIDIPGYDSELLKVLTASAMEAREIINDCGIFPKITD